MTSPALFASEKDPEPLIEINTTPLIDILLVLLIMLIINLPLMHHATIVESPGGTPTTTQRERIALDIEYDGSLYWNDTPVTLQQLEQYLRSIAARPEQPDVVVTANRGVKYDRVAHVLAAAQRNGVQRIGFGGNERFVEQ